MGALVHAGAVAAAALAVASASTPPEAKRAKAQADALRDLLAKAVEVAGEDAPRLAVLKREAEEVALNAALKLGGMVPAPVEGAGKNRPSQVATVATWAEGLGISRSTARNLRALHQAFEASPEVFGELVSSALNSGKPVPLGALRKLADKDTDPDSLLPGAEEPPKAATSWLADAVRHAMRALEECESVAKNTKAPPGVRAAAKGYAEGVARLCGDLRRALNSEVSE